MFSKFKLRGGRGGVITAREGKRVVELSWETLLGESDMIIYGDYSSWVKPERHAIAVEELQRLVDELAHDMHINIELNLSGSSQVFRGRRLIYAAIRRRYAEWKAVLRSPR